MLKTIEIWTDVGYFYYTVDFTDEQITELTEKIETFNKDVQEQFAELDYDPFIYIGAVEDYNVPVNTVDELVKLIKTDWKN